MLNLALITYGVSMMRAHKIHNLIIFAVTRSAGATRCTAAISMKFGRDENTTLSLLSVKFDTNWCRLPVLQRLYDTYDF